MEHGPAMKRLGLLLMMLHLVLQPVAGETRFAVLRFEDVTSELPSYKAANERMEIQLEQISKDPRNVQMQKTMTELEGVLKQIAGLTPTTDRATRVELASKAESLRKEADALRTDFAAFEATEVRRIKREMLDALKPIQSRVRKMAAKVAEERGFDCLFETKGNSNTSTSVLVYAKNPFDITGDVLAALKAEEPPAPDKPADGAPAPAKPAPEKPAASKPAPAKPTAKP